jgi:hypothetical protein
VRYGPPHDTYHNELERAAQPDLAVFFSDRRSPHRAYASWGACRGEHESLVARTRLTGALTIQYLRQSQYRSYRHGPPKCLV